MLVRLALEMAKRNRSLESISAMGVQGAGFQFCGSTRVSCKSYVLRIYLPCHIVYRPVWMSMTLLHLNLQKPQVLWSGSGYSEAPCVAVFFVLLTEATQPEG